MFSLCGVTGQATTTKKPRNRGLLNSLLCCFGRQQPNVSANAPSNNTQVPSNSDYSEQNGVAKVTDELHCTWVSSSSATIIVLSFLLPYLLRTITGRVLALITVRPGLSSVGDRDELNNPLN